MAEQEFIPSAYDFDPAEESPTVKIQILPGRYVRINGRTLSPTRKVTLGADGKRKLGWEYGNAEIEVPARVADELCVAGDDDQAHGIPPVARVVETVSAKRGRQRKPADGSDE